MTCQKCGRAILITCRACRYQSQDRQANNKGGNAGRPAAYITKHLRKAAQQRREECLIAK